MYVEHLKDRQETRNWFLQLNKRSCSKLPKVCKTLLCMFENEGRIKDQRMELDSNKSRENSRGQSKKQSGWSSGA